MADAGTDKDGDVALRCRALTLIYAGGNSRAFAGLIEISPTRWNNIETGGALSKDVARTIIRKFPEISLDWLFLGRDSGLTRVKSDELLAAYRTVRASAAPVPSRKKAVS